MTHSIDDVFAEVGTVGGQVGTVGGQVGTVGGQVGTVGGQVGTAIGHLTDIKSFFNIPGGGGTPFDLNGILQSFFDNFKGTLEKLLNQLADDADFVKGLIEKAIAWIEANVGDELKKLLVSVAKAFGQIFDVVGEAFTDAVHGIVTNLGNLVTKFTSFLSDFWDLIVKTLSGAIKHLADFPQALQCGPMTGFAAAQELHAFLSLSQIQLNLNIENRVTVMINSFEALFTAIGGNGDLSIIKDGFDQLQTVFKGLIQGADPSSLLETVLLKIVFPESVIVDLLKQAFNGKWWSWAELPCGMQPGALHKWINDPGSYADLSADLVPLARQFRCRIVAVIDAYLRCEIGTANIPVSMPMSDSRMSFESLSDIVCTLLDSVIRFVFEPECFPQLEADLDAFEDVGIGFSSVFARQIRLSIRGSIGLLFRGVWVYSIQNDALIELIASVLGVSFSAIVEAVLRHLTWTIQIVTRYKGDPYGGPAGFPDQLPMTWDSMDQVRDASGTPIQAVQYIAFVRIAGVDTPQIPLGGNLQNLLKDFGAYLDASYQQFRIDSRFPNILADTITVQRSDIVNGRLTVWATTSAFAEVPRPVLRVYFCCEVLVMQPGATPQDSYVLEFNVPKTVGRNCSITLLSNRGGRLTSGVTRS